jgi:primosomal protein N' (replication factor Y)
MAMPAGTTVRVMLTEPVGPYDYLVPPGMALAPGAVVLVPLGRRQALGVVWDAEPAAPPIDPARLRPVAALFDVPPMRAEMRRFVDWVAAYTLSLPGAVLRMALSVPAALTPPEAALGLLPAQGAVANTHARRRVLAALGEGPARLPVPRLPAELAREAAVSPGVVRAMVEAGLLAQAPLLAPPPPWPVPQPASLTGAQAEAAAALRAAVGAAKFSVTLLQGVTGSGKTEVYLDAVAACLAAGRQALVLLPEIALSAQLLARFTEKFGQKPAAWHSELTGRTRRSTWRAVAEGQEAVVVGARSALWLPFARLGLIVVDEEHETAFKQEEGVIYHARDMAVVRARLEDAACVLVSATPSLETITNVEAGRYARKNLPARIGGAGLPRIAAIDLLENPPGRGKFLAPPLLAALGATLAAGEQALLFLNRRGFAPLTLCRACGHRLQCPNCTAWLVEHRARRRLECHHCGHTERSPEKCPSCGAEGSMAPAGPGVERIHEEAAAAFPEARIAVMASDTLPGPHAAAAMAKAILRREIDLIIGTQVVAKGWHFPHLTLVGVVDADLGLMGGDLRTAERCFALLHQVAGRAGRDEAPGRVMLQTVTPSHPVMRALVSGDSEKFLAEEAAQRQPTPRDRIGWPPYGRLAALILSGTDEAALEATCRDLARAAPRAEGLAVLGPAPAPLSILRGKHRRRFLLRAARGVAVQPPLRAWLSAVDWPRSVHLAVDIDPVSFL